VVPYGFNPLTSINVTLNYSSMNFTLFNGQQLKPNTTLPKFGRYKELIYHRNVETGLSLNRLKIVRIGVSKSRQTQDYVPTRTKRTRTQDIIEDMLAKVISRNIFNFA